MSQHASEWHRLSTWLNDANLSISCTFKNSFYNRLVIVIQDAEACAGDIASAYRDAIMGAPSENREDGLPGLGLTQEDKKCLENIGLKINFRKQIKIIENELQSDDGPVDLNKIYSFHKVSKIKQYSVDPVLSKLFKNGRYEYYKGSAQATAVRINLKAQGNATTIVNLPTGTGKTLIAHALSLCEKNKLTLVIVPTTALAIDQGNRAKTELSLQESGCYFWYGSQDQSQKTTIKSNIRLGCQAILFVSPEAACQSLLLPLFDAAKAGLIGSIVIDEAHMVAEWGDGFRPYYQIFGSLVASLREISPNGMKCCLMTATLTEPTMQYLKDTFADKDNNVSTVEVHGSFLRSEIQFHTHQVKPGAHKNTLLKAIRLLPKPLIVYVSTISAANTLQQDIMSMQFSRVGLVTSKVSDNKKKDQLNLWNSSQLDIMVATSAFGMGVNKENVRSVLHADVPPNIDSFYQQVGRSGRDGYSSQSMVIWHKDQITQAMALNRKKRITLKLGVERWKEMWRLSKTHSNDEVVVDLKSAHSGMEQNYSREENEKWNRRVLLSMQRTGMVQTSWPVPQPPEYDKSLTNDENKATVDEYFKQYYGTLNVTPIVDNHQEPETWNSLYGPQLENEQHHTSKGFETLSKWLKSPRDIPLCKILEATYSIGDVTPEKVCNGCPGCRAKNFEVYLPEVGHYCSVIGFVEQNSWSEPLNNKNPDLNLYYSTSTRETPSTAKFIDKYSSWIITLLERGIISTIRAEPHVLTMLKDKIFRKYKGFWVGIDINQSFTSEVRWPELILIMPEANIIPEFVYELSFTPRMLVAPDHIISDHNNGARWWEKTTHTSNLKHFKAGNF